MYLYDPDGDQMSTVLRVLELECQAEYRTLLEDDEKRVALSRRHPLPPAPKDLLVVTLTPDHHQWISILVQVLVLRTPHRSKIKRGAIARDSAAVSNMNSTLVVLNVAPKPNAQNEDRYLEDLLCSF